MFVEHFHEEFHESEVKSIESTWLEETDKVEMLSCRCVESNVMGVDERGGWKSALSCRCALKVNILLGCRIIADRTWSWTIFMLLQILLTKSTRLLNFRFSFSILWILRLIALFCLYTESILLICSKIFSSSSNRVMIFTFSLKCSTLTSISYHGGRPIVDRFPTAE